MALLDDREHAFENLFAHDEELRFKAVVRRNKLLGLWAAGLLGKSGEEAAAYAAEVVTSDFQRSGHEDVVEKLLADFGAAGAKTSETEIREKMLELLPVAAAQVQNS